MYENQTFEAILARMLARIPDTLDKRQGSIIYDALAPAAAEIAQAYIALENLTKLTFAGTAFGDYLVRRAAELGITKNMATVSTIKGQFKNPSDALMDIPVGSRFSKDAITFVVTEKISAGVFKLNAETAGEIGNVASGSLMPISYISGLATAEIIEVLVPGEDEEQDEALQERYFNFLMDSAQDGNEAQYKKWADEYPGIGKSKVFKQWDGPNTVKQSILSSEGLPATQELIDAYQEYLDPGSQGLGNGKAPCGAIVTVTTATGVNLTISADATLSAGYTAPEGVEEAIIAYLKSIAYTANSVSYLRIASVILEQLSISDIANLTINGGTVDISIGAEEVAVLEDLDLGV